MKKVSRVKNGFPVHLIVLAFLSNCLPLLKWYLSLHISNEVIKLTLVIMKSLGLAKLPLYNRNIVIRGQQNKEAQSRNEIWDFRMYSL